jgi:hypothetical protein
MRTLITADIHISDNSRDEYRIKFLKTFRDLCRKYKVDTAIVLGDLTEAKDNHSAELVNQIVDHFYKLAGICKDIIVLKGNHDYLTPETPFFRFLQRIEGVTWVNAPTDEKNASTTVLKRFGACLWLPHTTNYKRDWEGLDLNRYDRIFAHQTFNGVLMGPGRQPFNGGVPLDVLPQTEPDQVISGDIHIPQQLGPVTYVGAPYTVDFGDDYSPRVILLEIDGSGRFGSLQSIPCLGPQKQLVEMSTIGDLNKFTNMHRGDILKIRVARTHAQMDRWHQMKNEIRQWCEKNGFIPYTIQPVIDQSKRMIASKEISESRSDEQILRDYGKLRSVNDPILKTGLSLLREV